MCFVFAAQETECDSPLIGLEACSLITGRVCRFALLAYLASVFGRRFVTSMWSGHTLALSAAIGGVLVCVGLLAWLLFRKSEPHTPSGL
jgi:membrane protein DedA with SNARE-associated domain